MNRAKFKCHRHMSTSMFDWLWNAWRNLKSLYRWWLNGNSKKHPLTGKYVSALREQTQTVILRASYAIYSLTYAMIFEVFAVLVEAIVGIFSDLWHSDRKHTRHFFGWIFSGLSSLVRWIIDFFKWISKLVISLWKFR